MIRNWTLALALAGMVHVVGCNGGGNGDAGTDAGTDAGGDVATQDTASDAPVTPTCDAYCTAIMANCTGANAQYSGMANCMTACAGFAVGTGADQSGNTLGCRTYHAGAAAAMPALHCAHAGPGGAGVCGMDCEGFCAIAQSVCTGTNQQFASVGECMTACSGFADTTPYSTAATSGNTLACRLYHLNVAAGSADAAMTHCPHIVASSPVCR